jgi:RNA polymerase sigma factor (sigma-70 family)
LATVLTSDRAVAEELVQEAFLEVMQRWDRVDNPAGYLRTVVVNRCRNHQRGMGVRRRNVPPAPPLTVDAPELDEMWAALAQLRPRRRTALVLRFYEDLPIDEIARLLDCRPGTVSSLLHRGLADLRKVLDDVA